jgi:hypothetical protein
MSRFFSFYTVVALLLVQMACLWFSLQFGKFSVFCTGASHFTLSASAAMAFAFGVLHLLLAVILCLGIAALKFARLRMLYVIAAVVCVSLLPVQTALVNHGFLTCDAP